LDTILRNNNLTPADIASVETRIWPYLFPIYANYCTVVVLNQEARAKGLVTDPIPNSDAKYEIYRSQKVEAFRIGNKTIESLKDCDRVHPLDFKKCQETVRRKLNLK